MEDKKVESKHSSLPWFANIDNPGEVVNSKHPILQIRGWSYLLRHAGVDAPKIQDANLAFVLEACNSYYALKQQLEEKDKEISHFKVEKEEADDVIISLKKEIQVLKSLSVKE